MKNLINKILIPVALMFAGCQKEEVEINQVLRQDGLRLEVTAINDSRCPIGADCIWEGEVMVSFNAQADGESADFDLYLSSQNDHKDTVVLGYKITLLEVNPYPVAAVSIPENPNDPEAQNVKVEIKK